MPDSFSIKSIFREYHVEFIDGFQKEIKLLVDEGAFFVIDANIFDLYKKDLEGHLPADRIFVIEANEEAKTLENSYTLIKSLMEAGIRKNNKLVAVGGGVIQDLTAFVSSIMFRGIEWVFFPTTLLAQADSCIGSKTSINVGTYKNILGNFYPPSNIFIDLKFLESLTERDIRSGIGEMLHFYFIAASPYADKVACEYERLFEDRSCIDPYIAASLAIKKDVIERDEFDRGERNLFNFGHTFGHAIETITDYQIPHGQAVTLGMDMANHISLKRGMIDQDVFDHMHSILIKNMPSFEMAEDQMDRYIDALSKDKKNTGSDLTCILTEGPGAMKKVRLPLDEQLRGLIYSCVNHCAMSES